MTPQRNASVVPHLRQSPDRCPSSSLQRIVAATQADPSDFIALTIPCTLSELYEAVLAYADLYGRLHHLSNPPILVDSFLREMRTIEDDDEEYHDKHGRDRNVPARRKRDIYGRLVVPDPKYKLGFGECAVVWPPPLSLSAEHLRELEKAEQAKREGSLKVEPPSDITEDTKLMSDAKVIFVVHFSHGEPRAASSQFCGTNGLQRYNELTLLTTDSPDMLRKFTKEVLYWENERHFVKEVSSKSHFQLYRYRNDGDHGYWNPDGLKRARLPSSIILPKGQLREIIEDIERFLKPETKQWYLDHGIPQRRCLLFYGSPGTGKTSTIRMLASRFGRSCCYLNVTGNKFSNQSLADAFGEMPKKALLVIEDVDVLFVKRTKQRNQLTFSGLLNALDGIVAVDGVVTIMTTNCADKLDAALLRGGRVDRRFLFDLPDDHQLKDLFLSFYPKAEPPVIDHFVRSVHQAAADVHNARSISTLQELFIEHREHSAQECVDGMQTFFDRLRIYADTADGVKKGEEQGMETKGRQDGDDDEEEMDGGEEEDEDCNEAEEDNEANGDGEAECDAEGDDDDAH